MQHRSYLIELLITCDSCIELELAFYGVVTQTT
jgi:hypothetical protein